MAILHGAVLLHQANKEHGAGTKRTHALSAEPTDLPFLGVTVNLEQYSSSEEQQGRLEKLRSSGFGWVRQRIDWADIEAEPGVFDWSVSDSIIDSINQAGLIPLIVLDGSPSWSRAGGLNAHNPLAPPDDYEDYARFVSEFARRYQSQVHYYQIWDEPNIAPHWGSGWIQPVEYAQMLRLASESIRAADSNAVIVLGALAPTWDRGHQAIDEAYFLQRLLAAGAADDFDLVAIQPFGFGDTPDDLSQHYGVLNFQRAQSIRRILVAAGQADKPLIAVRYGWNRVLNSPWRTVSDSDQADFTVRALDIGYKYWPWLSAMAYAIDQPDAPLTDTVWGFSLNESLEDEFSDWSNGIGPREIENEARFLHMALAATCARHCCRSATVLRCTRFVAADRLARSVSGITGAGSDRRMGGAAACLLLLQ